MPSPFKEHTQFFLCSPDGSLPIFFSAHMIGIKRKTTSPAMECELDGSGDQARTSQGASFMRRSVSGMGSPHLIYRIHISTEVRTYLWEKSTWYPKLSPEYRQSYVPPDSDSYASAGGQAEGNRIFWDFSQNSKDKSNKLPPLQKGKLRLTVLMHVLTVWFQSYLLLSNHYFEKKNHIGRDIHVFLAENL